MERAGPGWVGTGRVGNRPLRYVAEPRVLCMARSWVQRESSLKKRVAVLDIPSLVSSNFPPKP
uniref:Uncharacterized protein n=1 Tax=Physcomitrium patens TaxID=3218 RepID=A0A2K1IID3_PHYPA|nr:hypothetical protein PHYPA_027731 [Physcomitrium patens]